jgi:hypothetical protein
MDSQHSAQNCVEKAVDHNLFREERNDATIHLLNLRNMDFEINIFLGIYLGPKCLGRFQSSPS